MGFLAEHREVSREAEDSECMAAGRVQPPPLPPSLCRPCHHHCWQHHKRSWPQHLCSTRRLHVICASQDGWCEASVTEQHHKQDPLLADGTATTSRTACSSMRPTGGCRVHMP
jgi:hypothetical protein